MKQINNIITIIAIMASLISCNLKNEKDNKGPFTFGKWHIVDYQKDGKEKKNLYTGFDFTFSQDNHIVATGNNHIYTGDWSVLKSDITDDAPITDIDFNILFRNKDGLSELNGEWIIVKKTNNYLSLIHMDERGRDFLIFEKG